ncbi:MAG: hypothetical protein IJ644_04170 [Oscillospiraceae bacterium]|nr:hypothetical protein [Oscillospiraceae bacterium]
MKTTIWDALSELFKNIKALIVVCVFLTIIAILIYCILRKIDFNALLNNYTNKLYGEGIKVGSFIIKKDRKIEMNNDLNGDIA